MELVACLEYNQSCVPGQVSLIQALKRSPRPLASGCAHGPESTIPVLVSMTDSILMCEPLSLLSRVLHHASSPHTKSGQSKKELEGDEEV